MARNWKFGEAVRAIQSGNKEDIMDIGKRFPLFLNLASQINEAGASLIDCVPDYCTARKIESVLKAGVEATEPEDDEDVEEEEEPPKKKPAKKPAKKSVKKPAKKPAKKVSDDDDDDDDDDDWDI